LKEKHEIVIKPQRLRITLQFFLDSKKAKKYAEPINYLYSYLDFWKGIFARKYLPWSGLIWKEYSQSNVFSEKTEFISTPNLIETRAQKTVLDRF